MIEVYFVRASGAKKSKHCLKWINIMLNNMLNTLRISSAIYIPEIALGSATGTGSG